MVHQQHRELMEQQGYVVVPQLFSPEEVAELREHFMALRAEGPKPGDLIASREEANDPLQKFPRMIHMHRWDETSLDWLLDERIIEHLAAFLGHEPFAVQTMLYFKPPGARGQAVHQDNLYLQTHPGTCMAAWMALDDCDEENGCMRVVPGSHRWPILCASAADESRSFTNVTCPLPDDCQAVPVVMGAGDVLFFNGSVVHGSEPNVSTRFRRSLIGHYVDGRATRLTEFDQPVLRPDGTELWLDKSEGGAPCGVWTDRDGTPHIVMQEDRVLSAPQHE